MLLPVQSKMARVALGLGVRELAVLAKVAPATVSRFEAGEELKERTVEAIQAALEGAGAILVPEDTEGPGVRLRKAIEAGEPVLEEMIQRGKAKREKRERMQAAENKFRERRSR